MWWLNNGQYWNTAEKEMNAERCSTQQNVPAVLIKSVAISLKLKLTRF